MTPPCVCHLWSITRCNNWKQYGPILKVSHKNRFASKPEWITGQQSSRIPGFKISPRKPPHHSNWHEPKHIWPTKLAVHSKAKSCWLEVSRYVFPVYLNDCWNPVIFYARPLKIPAGSWMSSSHQTFNDSGFPTVGGQLVWTQSWPFRLLTIWYCGLHVDFTQNLAKSGQIRELNLNDRRVSGILERKTTFLGCPRAEVAISYSIINREKSWHIPTLDIQHIFDVMALIWLWPQKQGHK